MTVNNSPLETLAAFSIAFASGVLFVLGLAAYVDKVRREAQGGRSTQ